MYASVLTLSPFGFALVRLPKTPRDVASALVLSKTLAQSMGKAAQRVLRSFSPNTMPAV